MDKKNRSVINSVIVNDMSMGAVQELLELVMNAPIEITQVPKSGLDMMHVLDAFDSEFHLGEVLVSTAEVALDGQRCFSMVIGDEPERALARACADAVIGGADEVLRARVNSLLNREEDRLMEQRSKEAQMIAATKVNFDLMAGQ